jgi:hypothetical protein
MILMLMVFVNHIKIDLVCCVLLRVTFLVLQVNLVVAVDHRVHVNPKARAKWIARLIHAPRNAKKGNTVIIMTCVLIVFFLNIVPRPRVQPNRILHVPDVKMNMFLKAPFVFIMKVNHATYVLLQPPNYVQIPPRAVVAEQARELALTIATLLVKSRVPNQKHVACAYHNNTKFVLKEVPVVDVGTKVFVPLTVECTVPL